MKPFVLLTGMFRSGTTLMARMLNAHPALAFASDPYLPIFKAFRNQHAALLNPDGAFDNHSPLDDYYFFPEKQALFRSIRNGVLHDRAAQIKISLLQEEIARYCEPFSPNLVPALSRLEGRTFVELIRSGMQLIDEVYGNGLTTMTGMKLVWAGEFAAPLLRAFPEAKVIHILRDPRSVCASKFMRDGNQYPLLFLARQWRKLASLAYLDSMEGHDGRVLVLRYEDLIRHPEELTRKICSFLDLAFDDRLLDPASFKDGAGNSWVQNTSFGDAKRGFNTAALERWKTVFTPEQIAFVERLCYSEMRQWSYEPVVADSPELPLNLIVDPPEVSLEKTADWILPYARLHGDALYFDLALEHYRGDMLSSSNRSLADEHKRYLALDERVYDGFRRGKNVKPLLSAEEAHD